MAGTKIGGQKAAATNKLKRGLNWYREIGRIGGRNGHTGGFAANPELAKIAGQKGGRISRRGPSKKDELRDIERTIQICKEVAKKHEKEPIIYFGKGKKHEDNQD